jgi:hypothetical protein
LSSLLSWQARNAPRRVKQEERLRAVTGQHEGLAARVQAQELDAEQRLDALDAALQVGKEKSKHHS